MPDPYQYGRRLFNDIESLSPADQSQGNGHPRFIEAKGRRARTHTITVTKNEILTRINSVAQAGLALVEVMDDGKPHKPRYVRRSFQKDPDFGEESVNYNVLTLIQNVTESHLERDYKLFKLTEDAQAVDLSLGDGCVRESEVSQ